MSASAEAMVGSSLRRIQQVDSRLHSVLETHDEAAQRRAKSLDSGSTARGPMHGMPVLLKDNICTRTGMTTCASRILEGYRSPYDAHVVERLEEAGAVIVGKTNLDEFAMGSSTENSSRFTTVNPWDLQRVAGGSSGGSVAAVAARLVPYALGSETGGSVPQPASLCGVCGLKPTYGRVSRYGLVAFASSLDQIGPVATDVKGIALLLRTIAGHDSRDSTSVNEPVPDYVAALDEPLGKLRIGIPREYFGEGLHEEVRSAVLSAVELYKKLGATVLDVSLPHTKYTIPVYYLIATAEASSNLARFDGVRYGHRTREPADYIDSYSSSRAEGFGAEVKRRIMLGTYALSSGYYDAYYLKALKVRTLIKRDFTDAFAQCDVILSPTTPTAAFKVGEKSSNPLEMYLSDIYTTAANLAGIPAISIPCGRTQSGLPIGLQLMAPALAEARMLRIACEFQRATDHHARRPPICAE